MFNFIIKTQEPNDIAVYTWIKPWYLFSDFPYYKKHRRRTLFHSRWTVWNRKKESEAQPHDFQKKHTKPGWPVEHDIEARRPPSILGKKGTSQYNIVHTASTFYFWVSALIRKRLKSAQDFLLTVVIMSSCPLATNKSRLATTKYEKASRCNTPGIRKLSQDTVEYMNEVWAQTQARTRLSSEEHDLLMLTCSLAVVWIDDEDTDDKELQTPPHDFPEQWATTGACAQQGVDGQSYGCAHYEHKPGGGAEHKERAHKTKNMRFFFSHLNEHSGRMFPPHLVWF